MISLPAQKALAARWGRCDVAVVAKIISCIRIFYDAFNQNDASLLDQIIAEDWVHIPPNFPDEKPGSEGFKEQVPSDGHGYGRPWCSRRCR